MNFSANNIYHLYNQGNNRQRIFLQDEDYLIFMRLYRRLFPSVTTTIAWCLMPNHFHFMIYTDERCETKMKQGGIFIDPVTNRVRKLLSGYARIFNSNYQQTGSVFRQKTKAKCISALETTPGTHFSMHNYYSNCFRYIHQNPLKASLVKALKDWPFSSYLDFAGMRNGSLCNKALASQFCGYNPATFIEEMQGNTDEGIIRLLK